MKRARLLSILLAILLLAGCNQFEPSADPDVSAGDPVNTSADASAGVEEHETVLFAMDTVMELTTYDGAGEEALEQASELISRLEGLLSTTDESSEIYAVNHSGGLPVSLSDDAAQLVEQALSLCGDTGGALDISIYPVVRTWGFTTGEYQVPDEDTLTGLLELVDYARISLEDNVLTVPGGMEIDLGAVAKGYTGDRIMEIFRQAGVTSAFVNLGGNIHTLGGKIDGTPWRLAIQDPNGDGFAGVVEVENKAVITSGGYERYFEADGVRYWHIIDPVTGCPAQSGLISATIVADSGVMGDALSTALFVMGREGAVDYWRSRGGFDFILLGEDGTVTITEGIENSFSLFGDWAGHELEVIRS